MSKKRRPEVLARRCLDALDRIDQAISNHRAGRPEDLNVGMLKKVRREIVKMSVALDKTRYSPSYGRFVSDWPDRHGLVDHLVCVFNDYERWA